MTTRAPAVLKILFRLIPSGAGLRVPKYHSYYQGWIFQWEQMQCGQSDIKIWAQMCNFFSMSASDSFCKVFLDQGKYETNSLSLHFLGMMTAAKWCCCLLLFAREVRLGQQQQHWWWRRRYPHPSILATPFSLEKPALLHFHKQPCHILFTGTQ